MKKVFIINIPVSDKKVAEEYLNNELKKLSKYKNLFSVLILGSSRLVLTYDKPDTTIYSEKVTSYSGMNIVTNGNKIIATTTKDTKASFVEATNGRPFAGYYFGVRVDAPKDIPTEDLVNSRLQVYVPSTGTWETRKVIEPGENIRYSNIWSGCTQEQVDTGKVFKGRWRYDWDGDGEYEQSVDIIIDTSQCTFQK